MKYKAITRKLAVFIGTTNVAASLVDNTEFREMLLELDRKHEPPGRKKIRREIDDISTELKMKILHSSNRIN